MIVNTTRLSAYASVVVALALMFLASCGPPPRPPEPTDLFWPLPPDLPKIQYVKSIYNEDDIGRVYTLKEKLFGKDYLDSLTRPYGVHTRRGIMLVSDISRRRVLLFDLVNKRLRVLGDDGAITTPASAATDLSGTIYVADTGGSKIAVYGPDGAYRTAYIFKGSRLVSVALNEALGRVYAVDREGHRVVAFGLDGRHHFEFGGRGSADGKFNYPLDITVAANGDVYVLDAGNFRVQIFSAEGRFLSKFGSVGDRPGMFANPKGIAVDSEGHIYVTDAAFSNLQIFDREGNVLLFIGQLGPRRGDFHLPGGVSIDENDRIYVADQMNGRVQVFQYLKTQGSTSTP
jgi:DNA-binding beta-propeller fold protein YncE